MIIECQKSTKRGITILNNLYTIHYSDGLYIVYNCTCFQRTLSIYHRIYSSLTAWPTEREGGNYERGVCNDITYLIESAANFRKDYLNIHTLSLFPSLLLSLELKHSACERKKTFPKLTTNPAFTG